MTLASIEKILTEELTGLYGVEEAAAITWIVIGHICKVDRSGYLSRKSEPLPEDQITALSSILQQLKTGLPVQYVLGETEFYGLMFQVDHSVLIPRPETEELVDWILKDASHIPHHTLKIIDIGTGSGCIPITLKRYLPGARISASDISDNALDIARRNAELNNTEVNFVQDDILESGLHGKYDIIVSNPPYITAPERMDMLPHVVDHEPGIALFVPGSDPLLFYRAICRRAKRTLGAGGAIYFEINEHLGGEMVNMLGKEGFKQIELRKDLTGRDRMIRARY